MFNGGVDVHIRLIAAETLVLFEWLHRNEEREDGEDGAGGGAYPGTGYYDIVDPSERIALCRVSGRLESVLAEPFRRYYSEPVAKARAQLRHEPAHNHSSRVRPPTSEALASNAIVEVRTRAAAVVTQRIKAARHQCHLDRGCPKDGVRSPRRQTRCTVPWQHLTRGV